MSTYVWHYTTEQQRLPGILLDGVIQAAVIGLSGHEKPVTWFSSNPRYEPTAIKVLLMPDGSMRQLTLNEQIERAGAARIAINRADAMPWARLIAAAKISPTQQRRLFRAARGANPGDWYGVIGSVPRERWCGVEVMRDGKWAALPDETWRAVA